MNSFSFTPDQIDFMRLPIGSSLFLEGPAGVGKTTAGVLRLHQLLEEKIPAASILILVPQRTLAIPYYNLISDLDHVEASNVSILTLDGLAQRLLNLFWPMISEKVGFSDPYKLPTYLTLESSQYHLAHLVRPLLLEEGFFESVSLDRNRLYSQILDDLNKAALVGFPHTEIGERLKAAWTGDPVRLSIYDDVQTCVNLFRQFCLQNNLLDYSLQIECFCHFLSAEPFVQEYLKRNFRHLISDNIEEDTPSAHGFISNWLPIFDSALLIFDWDAGYRSFLGADASSAYRLKEFCELNWVFNSNLVCSKNLLKFSEQFFQALQPKERYQWQSAKEYLEPVEFYRMEIVKSSISELDFSKNPPVKYEIQRYFTEMLDWITLQVTNLVQEEGVPLNEIVILAPYLSDSLRFSLQNRLSMHGIPARSHRPSRSLRDEPATRCLLTLSALAFPEWGFIPDQTDVVNALIQAIEGLDLVRAQLLTSIAYRVREGKPTLGSFEVIQQSVQSRITFLFGERYEQLRKWLILSQETHTELDHFISRLFGEILSQPGFGFHSNVDAGVISANLIESIRKFRWALGDLLSDEGIPIGKEYFETVQDGLVAAQYLSRWRSQPEEGVLIAPAFSFLLGNQPVDYQFWLDISSRGWHERLEQPLTHPYVLSNNWPIGQLWTDADEVLAGENQLARLVLGLIRRCKKTIYLGISELDDQGYEERGLLLRIFQKVLIQEAELDPAWKRG